MGRPKHIQRRFLLLRDIGCIVSRIAYGQYSSPDIHHLIDGNKRMGDEFTIPLSPWHHRGVVPSECANATEAERMYGPSLARNKRAFVERFGPERDLLDRVNDIIADMERAA